MTTSGSNDHAAFRRALGRAASEIRRPLPWVGHSDPWAVLVSEVMLQQTQTARVVEPWTRFMERFPTPADCATSTLDEVLRHWAGLGYHRRAKALHEAARQIHHDHGGVVPSDVAQLRQLPGVGEYTANAVASFAFARRVGVLDTNVGRVLARALSNETLSMPRARRLLADLLPRREVARFNQAMLDLGAQFCRATPNCEACPVQKVCHWQRVGGPDPAVKSAGVSRAQSRFEGSDRQIRGMILGRLRTSSCAITSLIEHVAHVEMVRLDRVLLSLERDGLIERRGSLYRLARA